MSGRKALPEAHVGHNLQMLLDQTSTRAQHLKWRTVCNDIGQRHRRQREPMETRRRGEDPSLVFRHPLDFVGPFPRNLEGRFCRFGATHHCSNHIVSEHLPSPSVMSPLVPRGGPEKRYLTRALRELGVQRVDPRHVDQRRSLQLLHHGREDLGVRMAHIHHGEHGDEVEVFLAVNILHPRAFGLGNDNLTNPNISVNLETMNRTG